MGYVLYFAIATILILINDCIKYSEISFDIPSLPIQIPAFMGTAISLVLAFKLNQSYERWWEARKIWGSITNDSRSLVLQLLNFTGAKNEERLKERIVKLANRNIAWCYALGQSLRKLKTTEGLNSYLSTEEINEMSKHYNIPLAIIQLNLEEIKELRDNNVITEFQYIQIDNTYVRLCSLMGQSERIKNTVFPKTYRLYLHYFIYIFLFTLFVSLLGFHGILIIAMIFFISLPFFLLEKTAFLLQDPFENRPTDIPVTSIARNIEINSKQLLGISDVPEPLKPDSFFLM
jgi:putative membrane protein